MHCTIDLFVNSAVQLCHASKISFRGHCPQDYQVHRDFDDGQEPACGILRRSRAGKHRCLTYKRLSRPAQKQLSRICCRSLLGNQQQECSAKMRTVQHFQTLCFSFKCSWQVLGQVGHPAAKQARPEKSGFLRFSGKRKVEAI